MNKNYQIELLAVLVAIGVCGSAANYSFNRGFKTGQLVSCVEIYRELYKRLDIKNIDEASLRSYCTNFVDNKNS